MTEHGPIVGVDLGGTNIQAAVVNVRPEVIARAHRPTEADRGVEHVVQRMIDCIDEACGDAGVPRGALAAIGIAAAGAVDIPRGVVLDAPNLGWENVPLRDIMAERLGGRVVVDNDVNGAVWGEHCAGAARGRGDALGVWVGTGIGGGLVLGGRLHHGELYTAGEIGQTVIEPSAPAGARTLEECASRTGLRRILEQRLPNEDSMLRTRGDGARPLDTAAIAGAFAAGDPLTVDVVRRSAELVGIAIANVVTLLALDTVVIGGGMTEAFDERYLTWIRASFRAAVFPDRCREAALLETLLRGDAALIGAAVLAQGSGVRDQGSG